MKRKQQASRARVYDEESVFLFVVNDDYDTELSPWDKAHRVKINTARGHTRLSVDGITVEDYGLVVQDVDAETIYPWHVVEWAELA